MTPTGGRRPPAPIGWGSLTVPTSFWRSLSRGGLGAAGSSRAPWAPPCQARRCRRRFRTTATGRARTPSIGSTRALRPERARSRALFTCVASPRTLSPAASPSSPVKGRKGRLELSRAAPRGDPSTRARKMRLTDFCNRLPSRAPCGSFDSRVFLVAPRCFASRRCSVSRPGTGSPWAFAPRRPGWGALPHAYRMSQPGEASLDGDAPASACAATSTWYPKAARGRARSLGPERSRVRWSAVLAEPRSTAPPRFTSRRRRSRPLTELATRPLTSPVTTLGGSTSLPIPFRSGPPGPASPAVSSKTKGSTVPGRLPSTNAPSPEHARRLRALHVGSRGARHRCRCTLARGFRHRDPASGAPSPAELGPARGGTRKPEG